MLGKYHLAFGITSSLAALTLAHTAGISVGDTEKVIFISCAALGSLLPDIDSPDSTLGKIVPFISSFIYKTVGHRVLFHDALVFIPLLILSIFVKNPIFLGIMFGYVGHLFLDSFTKSGICFNYFGNRKAIKNGWGELGVGRFYILPEILRFKGNSFIAKAFTVILCFVNLYIFYSKTYM